MVERSAKDVTEAVIGKAPFAVGDVVFHPHGFLVKIMAGQYRGTCGLSNQWSYQRVAECNNPVGSMMQGFGWDPQRAMESRGAAQEGEPPAPVM
jgi:hypothetical protein